MRIGHGYDVHRLVKGRPLILGGVHIPHLYGLDGHSDADVLVHAVIDSLYGAAALGDIGKHFSDSDPQYKDISSIAMLEQCRRQLSEHGYKIVNIDATLIAQRPKVAEYTEKMRARIAEALAVSASQVSVKATTEEGLGFTGAGEGMAAHAVCIIE